MTVDEFIERWRSNEGGAERANYALFLTELCSLLGLPQPDPANATHEDNDYVFERGVTFRDEAGKAGHGRIDLYKRGCFVLEAKQSRQHGGKKVVAMPEQSSLLEMDAQAYRGRRSAHRGWDVLMRNAREQAEQYARALPTDHGWRPSSSSAMSAMPSKSSPISLAKGKTTGCSRIAPASASTWMISATSMSAIASARSGSILTASIPPGAPPPSRATLRGASPRSASRSKSAATRPKRSRIS